MNKYKKVSIKEKVNLNVYSAILSMNLIYMLVVEKVTGVFVPPGGVALYGNMLEFSEKEKFRIFSETMINLFNKDGNQLYDISDHEITTLYHDVLTSEIKDSVAKFNAMLEALQESGKFFFRNFEQIHYKRVGGHEKFFFKGSEYILFSVTDGDMSPMYIEEDGPGRQPIDGRDFYCQDSDLLRSHVEIEIREFLESIESNGKLFKRYGRGEHLIAVVEMIDRSGFLLREENKDLIYAFQKLTLLSGK